MSRKENGIYVVCDSIEVSRYKFDGTAENVKTNIDLTVEKAMRKGMIGEGRFYLDISNSYGSTDIEIVYYFDREENAKEKALREKAEAKQKEAAAEKLKKAAEAKKLKEGAEYAEFLRLKKKFGGKSK